MSTRQPPAGLSNRYRSLKAWHREIENKIASEMARPLPDFLAVQALKRQRLRTKDELERLGGVLRLIARPELPGAA